MTETRYMPELAAEITFRMSNGESLRRICRDPRMPPESTVRSWAKNNTGGFGTAYHDAQLLRVDCLADELLAVAYDPEIDPADKRVITENLRWLLSRVSPKRFGDRLLVAGDSASPISILHENLAVEALSPAQLEAVAGLATAMLAAKGGG